MVNDGDAERMINLATQQNVRLLCDADVLFMDGTFKIAPEMFHQVYSIYIMNSGIMIPVAVILLPSKTKKLLHAYVTAFDRSSWRDWTTI